MPRFAVDPAAMAIALYPSLAPIEGRFDALILDVWGVVMDGTAPYRGAPECLVRLKERGKTVLLLSNAPRCEAVVAERLAGMGIGPGLYDRIVSSGEASRRALDRRANPAFAPLKRYLYIGPDRDRGLLAGLDYCEAPLAAADFVLNTGVADDSDTVEVYRPILEAARARDLPMVCTNPDHVVVRQSGERVLCAGALAEAYEALGGVVHYFGKPHRAIYELCFELLDGIDRARVFAVGDNLETDIAGAKAAGLATVLVLGGVLAEPLGIAWGALAPPARLEALCAEHGVVPDMAIPALIW